MRYSSSSRTSASVGCSASSGATCGEGGIGDLGGAGDPGQLAASLTRRSRRIVRSSGASSRSAAKSSHVGVGEVVASATTGPPRPAATTWSRISGRVRADDDVGRDPGGRDVGGGAVGVPAIGDEHEAARGRSRPTRAIRRTTSASEGRTVRDDQRAPVQGRAVRPRVGRRSRSAAVAHARSPRRAATARTASS